MDNLDVSYDNIRASRVTGTKVYNAQNESLGTIEDVVIGKVDGKAKYAIMSFGGFLGIGEEYHPVPWDQLTYSTDKGGYVVNLTKEQLEGAPRYASGSEPDYADRSYNDRVYGYYGSTYY